MHGFVRTASWCTLVLGFCIPVVEAESAYRFRKIAESGQMDPSGAFVIGGFDTPALHGGKVVFGTYMADGSTSSIVTDIRGTLESIASILDEMPGSLSGNYEYFGSPIISDSGIAFRALGAAQDNGVRQEGIYKWLGDSVEIVADRDADIPGGAGKFKDFGDCWIHGEDVAFIAEGSGVYFQEDGTLSTWAAAGATLPGLTAPIAPFGDFYYDGHRVAIMSAGKRWVLLTIEDSRVVIEANLPQPFSQGGQVFYNFNANYGYDDGKCVFLMDYPIPPMLEKDFYAVFLADNGTVVRLFDQRDVGPPEGGRFVRFSGVIGYEDGAVYFSAIEEDNEGFTAYRWVDGELTRILSAGEQLDGKTIFSVWFLDKGIEGSQLALHVRFTDWSSAIYLAEPIPEPATLSLLTIGALCGIGRSLRRRRSARA
jgi:hypothetical protein